MRSLEFLTGNVIFKYPYVIFKLRNNQIYQLKTTFGIFRPRTSHTALFHQICFTGR
jgi:hypothetical protein